MAYDSRVIYGEDNRKDLYDVSPAWVELATATVALFDKADVKFNGDMAFLNLRPYQHRSKRICSTEAFFDQKIGAFCSGALVTGDAVLTAGHCMSYISDCNGTYVVFGFGLITLLPLSF